MLIISRFFELSRVDVASSSSGFCRAILLHVPE
jgi:hypothetical protein